MVCLRNISVDTLHKEDTEDDDDNNDDNNNNDNNNSKGDRVSGKVGDTTWWGTQYVTQVI